MSDGLYARPRLDEAGVQAVLRRAGAADASMTDLGGTMSLNLHLPAQDLVLRVHPRFVTPNDSWPSVACARDSLVRALSWANPSCSTEPSSSTWEGG